MNTANLPTRSSRPAGDPGAISYLVTRTADPRPRRQGAEHRQRVRLRASRLRAATPWSGASRQLPHGRPTGRGESHEQEPDRVADGWTSRRSTTRPACLGSAKWGARCGPHVLRYSWAWRGLISVASMDNTFRDLTDTTAFRPVRPWRGRHVPGGYRTSACRTPQPPEPTS
jgi:hypothetical protein